jgi:hypothetical protein
VNVCSEELRPCGTERSHRVRSRLDVDNELARPGSAVHGDDDGGTRSLRRKTYAIFLHKVVTALAPGFPHTAGIAHVAAARIHGDGDPVGRLASAVGTDVIPAALVVTGTADMRGVESGHVRPVSRAADAATVDREGDIASLEDH